GYERFPDQQGFTDSFATFGGLCLHFIICWPLAGPVYKLTHRLLTTADKALIYFCLMLATVVPSMGHAGYLFPLTAGLSYYARPDNHWQTHLVDRAPPGLIPRPGLAVTWYYEGVPVGEKAPWGVWLGPMGFWGLFFLLVCTVSLAFMVLMRKQWQEHEHLAYPLTALPLELVGAAQLRDQPLFRSGLFWVGVVVAFALIFYNGFTFLVSGTGLMALNPLPYYRVYFNLFRGTGGVLDFNILFVGLGYLVTTDALLSIWSFHWLTTLVAGVLTILGVNLSQGPPHAMGGTALAMVQTGSLLFVVGGALWTARQHLALTWRGRLSDEGEIASYRMCWTAVLAGLAVLWYLLTMTGLGPGIALATLLSGMMLFLGTTQLLALTGFGSLRAPNSASGMVFDLVGTGNLGPQQMVGLGFSYIWAGDLNLFSMGTGAMGLRVLDLAHLDRPRVAVPTGMVALVASMVACYACYLYFPYRYGGVNASGWFFNGSPGYHWGWIANHLQSGEPTSVVNWLLLLLGASLTALVSWLHRGFTWWPVHPAGLAISATQPVRINWFSCFVAWLVKLLLLHYGGPRAYRAALPLFLGFIAGGSLGYGMNFVVKILTA
ncbi:MAG: hypothetical protein GX100_12380, partial [candidate division WS1 bacterium]|nr:hypothetical protein [candidate division WS1 bacterium]